VSARPYGVLAEFARPEDLLDAIRLLRAEGYRRIEAFTPYPVHGLAEAIGFNDRTVPRLFLLGGVLGGAVGIWMQVYANQDYPIDVGGRPLIAMPAFLVVAFELTILFAVLVGIVGMLAANRLPRLNHPVFEAPRFGLASLDRFFLCVLSSDRKFDTDATRARLATLNPVSLTEVEA
jgi:hypothetical protein